MPTLHFDLVHHVAVASFVTAVGMRPWVARWAARVLLNRQVGRWRCGLTEAAAVLPAGDEAVAGLRSCADDLRRSPSKVVARLSGGAGWDVPSAVPGEVEAHRQRLIAIADGYVSLAVPRRRRDHPRKVLTALASTDSVRPPAVTPVPSVVSRRCSQVVSAFEGG